MKDIVLILALTISFISCFCSFLYIEYLTGAKFTAKRILLFIALAIANLVFLLVTNLQNITAPIIFTLNVLLLFVQYIILYRANILTLLAIATGYTFHIVCARALALSVISVIKQNSLYKSTHDIQYEILSILFTSVFLMCVFTFYACSWTRKEFMCLLLSKKKLRSICIVEISLLVYQLICANVYYIDIPFIWFTAFHFFGALMALWIHYLLFHRAIRFGVWLSESFKNDLITQQLNRQLSHYEAYKKHFDSFIEFRPEYDKMIGCVRHFISNDDFNSACELLHKINGDVQKIESQHIQFSNNVLLDSIFWDTSCSAQNLNIKFNANVFLPESLILSDLEISRIFSNLCANALEACIKMDENSYKFITFYSVCANDWLTLTAINSFTENIKIINGVPKTSKPDDEIHGIGISSVLNILTSHNGFADINVDDSEKIFKFAMHLPLA